MKLLRMLASVFVLFLMAGFVLAFSVYSSYSDLSAFHRESRTKFADWEAALAPRRALISELSEILAPYSPQADMMLREAEQARADAPGGDDIESRLHMHEVYGMKLAQLRNLALRYPQLRDSDDFRAWEADYLKQSIAEEATRTAYNSTAGNYNNVLDSFTGKLISFFFSVSPKPVIPAPVE